MPSLQRPAAGKLDCPVSVHPDNPPGHLFNVIALQVRPARPEKLPGRYAVPGRETVDLFGRSVPGPARIDNGYPAAGPPQHGGSG